MEHDHKYIITEEVKAIFSLNQFILLIAWAQTCEGVFLFTIKVFFNNLIFFFNWLLCCCFHEFLTFY